MPYFIHPELFQDEEPTTERKLETACCMEEMMEEPVDPKLNASLELLEVLSRMLDHLCYMGISRLDAETATERNPLITMKIGFIREAVSMLEPALKNIEAYIGDVATMSEEDMMEDGS
jgi:hypothetical protein